MDIQRIRVTLCDIVASIVEAWIEIIFVNKLEQHRLVASIVEAWIEIFLPYLQIHKAV